MAGVPSSSLLSSLFVHIFFFLSFRFIAPFRGHPAFFNTARLLFAGSPRLLNFGRHFLFSIFYLFIVLVSVFFPDPSYLMEKAFWKGVHA